jgi:hypothetical protein
MNPITILAATLMYIALPAYGISNWQPIEKCTSAASTERAAMHDVVVSPAAKPRITYQQFVQQQPQVQQHTIAGACRWRIEEATKLGARALGDSMFHTLRRLSKEEIGAKALPLKPQDLTDHGRARIAGGVKPATVLQDITALRGTIRDYVDANDLPTAWTDVFEKAMRRLLKEQLVGPSAARVRLPLVEEIDLLRKHFAEQNQHPLTITDMVVVVDAGLLTGRRISELCRIERQHVNVEKKTCMVYDLKNSKGKGYHGEFALIEGAWELFAERLAAIPPIRARASSRSIAGPARSATRSGRRSCSASTRASSSIFTCTTTAPRRSCGCCGWATRSSRSRRASRFIATSRRSSATTCASRPWTCTRARPASRSRRGRDDGYPHERHDG